MNEPRKTLPRWLPALAAAVAVSWAAAGFLWWELTTLEAYVEAVDQRLQDEVAERESSESRAQRP